MSQQDCTPLDSTFVPNEAANCPLSCPKAYELPQSEDFAFLWERVCVSGIPKQFYQYFSLVFNDIISLRICETYDRSNIKIAPLITDNKFYSIYTFQAFLFFCKIAYHLRFS